MVPSCARSVVSGEGSRSAWQLPIKIVLSDSRLECCSSPILSANMGLWRELQAVRFANTQG